MTFQVRTFSFETLALFNGLGSIPVVGGCLWIALTTKWLLLLLLIIPLYIILAFFGHKLATKDSTITIDDTTIKIDDLSIARNEFSDYFINDFGVFMVQIELMLKNGTVHEVSYKSFGNNGSKFWYILKELDKIKKENRDVPTKLKYEGAQVEMVKKMKPLIYALMGVVILIDLWWVYSILTRDASSPTFKILLINLSFLYFLPYLKKRKNE